MNVILYYSTAVWYKSMYPVETFNFNSININNNGNCKELKHHDNGNCI